MSAARDLPVPPDEMTDAVDVLAWTARTFGDRWIVASSMRDAVLVDLAVQVKPDVPVLFLDTGYHSSPRDIRPSAVNRARPGADPRSGRWAGRGKTECGLHG